MTMTSLISVAFYCAMLIVVGADAGKNLKDNPISVALLNNMLRLERTVAEMRSEFKSLKADSRPFSDTSRTRTAFEALLSKETPISHNEALKFDNVTINSGNVYNPKSGIFLVPVDGTYLFWANIIGQKKDNFRTVLMEEGQELTRAWTGNNMDHGTATINHLVKLKKGDHVWFAVSAGSSGIRLLGDNYCSFGAILMY